MSNESERLREQLAGPSHYSNVEKFKILALLELWEASMAFMPHSQSVNKPSPGYLKALSKIQEALNRLG